MFQWPIAIPACTVLSTEQSLKDELTNVEEYLSPLVFYRAIIKCTSTKVGAGARHAPEFNGFFLGSIHFFKGGEIRPVVVILRTVNRRHKVFSPFFFGWPLGSALCCVQQTQEHIKMGYCCVDRTPCSDIALFLFFFFFFINIVQFKLWVTIGCCSFVTCALGAFVKSLSSVQLLLPFQ